MSLATPVYPRDPTDVDDGIEILFLEDDVNLAEMYRQKLELDGYRVRMVPIDSVPPGSISEPKPELLFVDTRGGTRRALRSLASWRVDARFRNTPAVIMSNWEESRLREEGIRLGPFDQLIIIHEPIQRH